MASINPALDSGEWLGRPTPVTELTLDSEPSEDFFRYLAYLVCFGLVVLGVAASTVPRKTR